MPINPTAPPESAPKRALTAVRATAKSHIESVHLGIGFVMGALVAILAR